MPKLHQLATALLLICVCAVAKGQAPQSGQFYVLGGGSESCGRWLEGARSGPGRIWREQWVLGYLTGYNSAQANGMFKSRQVYLDDEKSASAFMDRYCSANPLSNVAAGTMALVQELGGEKTDLKWKR